MATEPPALDDLDPLMPIGMFSRASFVSVKALRAYHEQGLLVPDSIDPTTGYRSYRVSQLTDAAIIKWLRDLDLPLRSVAEVLRARDPEITRKVIAEHESAMRDRLTEVTRIVDQLQQSLELPGAQTPVHVRDEPETHALVVAGVVDEAQYGSFLDDAFARLHLAVARSGATVTGPSAARYPPTFDREAQEVEAFVPVAAPVAVAAERLDTGVTLGIIPAATCAVMTHVGGYDSIGETYRRLGAWVARNCVAVAAPVREHYVVSIDVTTGALAAPDQLRTEIAWPVARPPGESIDHTPTERNHR
ncbi:MAG: MerR family transcriptional regulator [Actinomycetota bacterium]